MLLAGVVHEVQFVHQAVVFQHFERPIDSDAIQLGVDRLGTLVEVIGIQMLAGLVDQVQQDLPLPGHPDAAAF